MTLPNPLRFSEGGNRCGLHHQVFYPFGVTLDRGKGKK
jgi:hypothetical protein